MTRLARVTALVLVAVTASCGGLDPAAAPTSSTSSATAPSTTAPGPSVTAAPKADLSGARVRLTKVATLDQPLAMAQCKGRDTTLVAQQGGLVRELGPDGSVLPRPFLDLRSEISAGGERGLLGITCSPDGTRFYASYTNRSGDSRLDELAVPADGAPADAGARRNLLGVNQPAPNHNGGNITFGPDGMLWYGLGDGGGGNDTFGHAQRAGDVLGSILRLRPADPTPEILVKGVRNPWRWSFDRATGDLWIGDVGQDHIEEIDKLTAGHIAGANLGWPAFEGTRANRRDVAAPADAVAPVFEYDHGEGQAVVGGYVYRGKAIPALVGAYLFADTYKGELRAIVVDGTKTVAQRVLLAVPGGLVSSFAEDTRGELYVLSLAGGVYRIDAG